MDEKTAEMVARGQKEIARNGSNLRVGAASEGAEIKLRAGCEVAAVTELLTPVSA